MQTYMVLDLRVLPLEGNEKFTETLSGILNIGKVKVHYHSDTLPPASNTYSNKAIPPNYATPYDSMGANYLQTTTFHYLVPKGL